VEAVSGTTELPIGRRLLFLLSSERLRFIVVDKVEEGEYKEGFSFSAASIVSIKNRN